MDKLFDILYRLARLLSGVPPDAAAMICAALYPPGLLVSFLLWIAEGLAMDLLKLLLISPLSIYAWRKLKLEERRFLIGLWKRFFSTPDPGVEDDD